MHATLIYVHDPMCSWCFGFEPARRAILEALAGRLPVRRLLGGLAPDSDEPMPPSTAQMIQSAWRRIEQVIPGTEFNFDFWEKCRPRRSTWPACRAVIAARLQDPAMDEVMTARIQQAYYREARNPSEDATLVELAQELELDRARFAADLAAPDTRRALLDEVGASRAIGIEGFPGLALQRDGEIRHIAINYNDPGFMLEQIAEAAGLD